MLPTLGRQRIGGQILGAGQNVGGPLQCVHEHTGRTQTVLQTGGQRFRNAAERLQLVVGVSQAVLVVAVKVAGRRRNGRLGLRVGRVNGPMVGDREQGGEELGDQRIEVEVTAAVDVTGMAGGRLSDKCVCSQAFYTLVLTV